MLLLEGLICIAPLLPSIKGIDIGKQTAGAEECKLSVLTGYFLFCRKHYPRPARLALWLMTEIAIIGSDIQEVIGSAIAILLLTNGRVPIWAGVLITAADSFAILLVERLGVRLLEAVFGGLIGVMAISFGVMYFWAQVPTGTVLEGKLATMNLIIRAHSYARILKRCYSW